MGLDLRIPVGLMFTALGLLFTGYGALTLGRPGTSPTGLPIVLLWGVSDTRVVEPGLEDRDVAAPERPQLRLVLVHADDVVAVLGEAGAGDEPDVAGPDDCDLHPGWLPALWRRPREWGPKQ